MSQYETYLKLSKAMTDLKERWQKCLEFIKDNIGEQKFKVLFSETSARSFDDNKLYIDIPSRFCFEIFEGEYYSLIHAAKKKYFGENVELTYLIPVIKGDDKANVNIPSTQRSPALVNKYEQTNFQKQAIEGNSLKGGEYFDPQLNPSHSFENYCKGESNKLAVTIAEYIANNPKNNNFNPFFLYGDVGIGKTHLIQAIGIRVKEQNPNAKVLFTTMKQFQTLYANAVITKQVPSFIKWFMGLDVLLLDDLQEIANKVKTGNDALFPVFNHLHQNGKQLVFTCDRPPIELDGIADRLIDRFKWGITEKLDRPDYELRKKILIFKAKHNGLDIPEEVLDLIATTATSSVRELEGIVLGILTRSITLNSPITLDLARKVMKHSVKIPVKKRINFDMIVEATSEYFRLNPDVLFSKSRVRDIADARQIIMFLCNKHTDLSSVSIGMKLNRRHATVLHGISTIKERMGVASDSINHTIEEIEHNLL